MKLPLEIGVKIEKDDPVVSFKEVMEGVELRKYLKRSEQDPRGREGYDPEVLLKIEAFPNKYTWVWKKACITSRDRKFKYLREFFTKLNNDADLAKIREKGYDTTVMLIVTEGEQAFRPYGHVA